MSIKDWPCWAKTGAAVGLAVFVLNWPTSSSEWAAWVQALGSIGAILGAVYLFDKDKKYQHWTIEENKKLKERSLVLSIRSELQVRHSQYMERIGSSIDKGELYELRKFEWKVPGSPFYVYTSSAAQLGVIENDLRALIIETYAELEGLLLTIDTLKEALRDKEDAEILVKGLDDVEFVEKTENHHKKAMRLKADCIRKIDERLEMLS